MKYISISTKLNMAVIGTALISLVMGSFVLFWYSQKIKNDVYKNTKIELINSATNQIESKMRVGITNAISIANDQRISLSLKTNSRQEAIDSLKDISAKMKKHTNFKNIKIHLHTKDNKSFLRNWKLDKYGDDLSSFRVAVVRVNKTQETLTTFEAGRAGLLLRAITPISDSQGKHLGSLEFIQGINSVVKSFDKDGYGFLLLMDNDVNANLKSRSNFSFNKDKQFANYIISQKYINKKFLIDAKKIDTKRLLKDGYILSDKYYYTYKFVKDFQNKELGIVLLAKPLPLVNSVLDRAENLIYLSLMLILSMILIIAIVIIIAIKKLVVHPLTKFEEGLLDFFSFLRNEKDFTTSIDIDTNDEFGNMVKTLEKNISYSAKLHEEIKDLNTHLNEMVDEKTKKVTTLLDNAGQGFLSFGCDLIIDEEYSKECIKLLGNDLAGKYIPHVLFQDSVKQNFFKGTILDACEVENISVQKTILTLLPHEIILNKRALKLDYKILANKSLMMIVTNITSQKKLEKKIKREARILKMIVEIISDSDSFYDTKKEYESFIKGYKNYISDLKTPLNNISEIYRTVHTFKGVFSQMYMSSVVNFLHSLESKLSLMLKDTGHTNADLLEVLSESDFSTSLLHDLNIIQRILGDEFLNSDNFLKINCADINKLQEKISTIFKEQHVATSESKELVKEMINLSNHKMKNLLKSYPGLVQQLAHRLEKEVYDFEIIGDDAVVINDSYKVFLKSLVHLFRNSIDHGIESPEERLKNDKDEIGTISCTFLIVNDTIQIIISDDGAGIDKEKVLQSAIKEKIINEKNAQLLSDEEIYNLIFRENFTTKECVSDISGRGVGMNAVQVEINKLGGSIQVNSQKGAGTTFILNLPQIEGVE